MAHPLTLRLVSHLNGGVRRHERIPHVLSTVFNVTFHCHILAGGGRASLFLTYCYCSVSSEDLVVWLLIVTYIIKHVRLYMYFTLFTNTFINHSFRLSCSHSVCTHASFSLLSQHHSHSSQHVCALISSATFVRPIQGSLAVCIETRLRCSRRRRR